MTQPAESQPQYPIRIAVAPPRDPNLSFTRPLTAAEIQYAREIFGDSIDYESVRITRGNILSTGASKTLGNTIHLQDKTWAYGKTGSDYAVFQDGSRDLTLTAGRQLFIHELTHVWQFQNGGWEYAPASLVDQALAYIETGDRNNAYPWREAYNAGKPWSEWGIEQQASAVAEYNYRLRKTQSGNGVPKDFEVLAQLEPYINQVQRGDGAFSIQNVLDDMLNQVPNPSEVIQDLVDSIPNPSDILRQFLQRKLEEFLRTPRLPIPITQTVQPLQATQTPTTLDHDLKLQRQFVTDPAAVTSFDQAIAQFGAAVTSFGETLAGLPSLATEPLPGIQTSPRVGKLSDLGHGATESESGADREDNSGFEKLMAQRMQPSFDASQQSIGEQQPAKPRHQMEIG